MILSARFASMAKMILKKWKNEHGLTNETARVSRIYEKAAANGYCGSFFIFCMGSLTIIFLRRGSSRMLS